MPDESTLAKPLEDEIRQLKDAVSDLQAANKEYQQEIKLLQERGDRYRQMVDLAQEGIWTIDPSGNTTFVNARMAEMLGYTVEEMLGRHLFCFMDDHWIELCKHYMENRRELIREQHDFEFMRKDGSRICASLETSPLIDQDGQYMGALAHVADITKRKLAEDALRDREEQYRGLVESCPDGITLTDLNGHIIMANQVAADHYGVANIEELISEKRNAFDIIVPEDRQRAVDNARKTLESGSVKAVEYNLLRKDGSSYPVEMSASLIRDRQGHPKAFIGVIRNITERKRAEDAERTLALKMQDAQRLQSIGLLAGGIAHDLNNLLLGITGNVELCRMALAPESSVRPYLDGIKATTDRLTEFIQQILAYAGKGKFIVKPIDLSQLVQQMVQLLQVSISKKISIEFGLMPDLPVIEADLSQIRQVIMNLITNAAEAIDKEPGHISVRTGVFSVDRNYLSNNKLGESLPTGKYVFLEVTDTGCGMTEDVREKIFDPFFTTKFVGRGLGLSAVQGIIRGHKGALEVRSEPGRGSTFKILLPCSETSVDEVSSVDTWKTNLSENSGMILVVDDEEVVRTMAKKFLEALGFNVLTAKDGREAVGLLHESSTVNEIDAVILDLSMPHMDGIEVLRELNRLRADLPVILSSGYNEQEATRHFSGLRLAGFLHKPYDIASLQEKLHEVIASKNRN